MEPPFTSSVLLLPTDVVYILYPVVSPSGMGGVQDTLIVVGPSWISVKSVGAEAAEGTGLRGLQVAE